MDDQVDDLHEAVEERQTGGTFENLEVWQEAIELGVADDAAMKGCSDYGFRQQIQEAVTSISSNIAEGYERDSNQEFVRFLIIAKGSCGEVRSQAYLARRVQLLTEVRAEEIVERAQRLSKRLTRLIQVRRQNFGREG